MKPIPENEKKSWRIATVWMTGWGEAQEALRAFHLWADLSKAVSSRGFSTAAPDFQRDVVEPLKRWRPDGVVLRVLEEKHLKRLRRALPQVPFVSTLLAPSDLVNTCVVGDMAEAIALARDHFHKLGVRRLALYCSGPRITIPGYIDAFRALDPDGDTFAYPHEEQHQGHVQHLPDEDVGDVMVYPHEEGSTGERGVRKWLMGLAKPVGVLATEPGAAGFLLCQCHSLGLQVSRDVQIIGVDNTEVSIACVPHLTGIHLPFERIGEVAAKTMLRLLRGEQPKPPAVIPVSGCTLTARDSTGLVHIGTSAANTALQLMASHGTPRLSTVRMARLSGVSRTTLYKKLGDATGQTPGHQMKQKRLKKACQMLRDTQATMATIAEACGYSSAFSFSRFFKGETGETPSGYRLRMKSGVRMKRDEPVGAGESAPGS
jgi:DNA-binding LacI/PurR family transcriptional regulator